MIYPKDKDIKEKIRDRFGYMVGEHEELGKLLKSIFEEGARWAMGFVEENQESKDT